MWESIQVDISAQNGRAGGGSVVLDEFNFMTGQSGEGGPLPWSVVGVTSIIMSAWPRDSSDTGRVWPPRPRSPAHRPPWVGAPPAASPTPPPPPPLSPPSHRRRRRCRRSRRNVFRRLRTRRRRRSRPRCRRRRPVCGRPAIRRGFAVLN